MSDEPPAEVIPLFEGIYVPDEDGSIAGVVRVLETALERARKGEIVSIIVGGSIKGNSLFRAWCTGTRPRTELVGVANVLNHTMLQEFFSHTVENDIELNNPPDIGA